MRVISKSSGVRLLVAMLAVSASGSAYAQQQNGPDPAIVVQGASAPAMTQGPEIKGVISARHDDQMKVTAPDGTTTIVAINDTTRIKAGGGLFGGNQKLAADSLLNGLPVTVKTLQPADGQS